MVDQPINYSIQYQDPFARSIQGLQLGQELAGMAKKASQAPEMEAIAAAEKLNQQRIAVAKKQELTNFVTNKNATAADYLRVLTTNPELKEPLKQGWEAMGAARKEALFGEGLQVLSALEGGQPELAGQLLAKRAEASRNSGDVEQAKIFDTYSKLSSVNPAALKQIIGLNLAAGDPAKFGETYERIAQLPGRVAQQGAELGKTTAETKKLTAEARFEEIKALFAPQNFRAALGLTAAQTESARGSAASSYASAAASRATAGRENAAAKQILSGVIPFEKRPEAEGKLRKEYSDQTKGYQDVKSAYSRILSVSAPKSPEEEGPADLALIFNYMKMLDPGSTVNTGEFANASNAAGVPDRIKNQYNKLVTGGRLNPTTRAAFTGQAKNLFNAASTQEKTVRKGVERIAKGYGLDPQNIFYEAVESTPVAPVSLILVTAPDGKSYNFKTQADADAFKKRVGVR